MHTPRPTIAVGRNDGQESDIWTYDLSGKSAPRRLTFGGNSRFPVWSADSRHITFQSERAGDRAIFWQAADGTGATERLTKPADGEEYIPEAWSRDGKHLLFSVGKASRYSLWVLTLDGKTIERFGSVESADPFGATFSPDGRWVAYAIQDWRSGTSPADKIRPTPAFSWSRSHQRAKDIRRRRRVPITTLCGLRTVRASSTCRVRISPLSRCP